MFWWGFQVLLVNAYLVYKRVCGLHGVRPMEHYEFRKDIAMGWIDPTNHGEGKSAPGYSTPSDQETLSTLSANSASSSQRRPKVSDSSLLPNKGSLQKRLNCSIGHWPRAIPADKHRNRPNCQMHKWATGLQKRGNIVLCADCNVALCLECFGPFHTVYDLVGEKERFAKQMRAKNDGEK